MPAAFLFDPNRCTGCQACELACSIENELGPDRSWREVVTFNDTAIPGVPSFHLSLACHHCSDPACLRSCPALAYDRDAVTGAVLIDPKRCIGCRYCSWACPYGAPRFEQERGVMGKCTFCSHRLSQGLKPACATLCPTGALDFADLPIAAMITPVVGFPQTDLGPSIRIEPARRSAYLNEASGPFHEPGRDPAPPPRPATVASPEITLRSEWSLAAFTFLTALLFAIFMATAGGDLRLPAASFATVAGVAAALSLSHLGRPERAWRAGLNVRRSWLSREVAGFGAFAVGGTAALIAKASLVSAPGASVALVGALTLLSADLVYRPVYLGRHPLLDGGGALVTGVYLSGLLLGDPWLAAVPWSVKAASVARDALRGDHGEPGPGRALRALAGPRALLGLALPAAAWIAVGTPLPLWVVLGTIVGEILGRAGFYVRLSVPSPSRQARADLLSYLARNQGIRRSS